MHRIDTYLDVIDPQASETGDQLGDYVRRRLDECTQLMAVVSTGTKESWWVPWEIGIATAKDYPIATYAAEQCALPTYLKKWPYLASQSDLDTYAREAKQAAQELERFAKTLGMRDARARTTAAFHSALRKALGQA
jgi:hypothetical protein